MSKRDTPDLTAETAELLRSIPESLLRSEIGRRTQARRTVHGGGRPPIMRTCSVCGFEGNTTEFNRHRCNVAAPKITTNR